MKERVVLLIGFIVFFSCGAREGNGASSITYEVLGNGDLGFSYKIYRAKKLLINQTYIPCVGGLQRFRTREQAEKVAKLVCVKLAKSGGLPTLTIGELDSLQVDYSKP